MNAILLLASMVSHPLTYGEVNAGFSAGSTLFRTPRARITSTMQWHPFEPDAWGGLGEINFTGMVLATVGRGLANGGIIIWAGYGRQREGFWLNFEGGFTFMVGSRNVGGSREFEVLLPFTDAIEADGTPRGLHVWEKILPAPAASLRAGWGSWSLRLMGIVTNRRQVLGQDYYALTLEKSLPWE